MMKNSSIRKRITLYYSLVLGLITLLVFGAFLVTAKIQTDVISKDSVMKAVQNGFDEVMLSEDTLQIDNEFDAFHKGIALLVYDEQGQLIKGIVPSGFPKSTPLVSGDHNQVNTDADSWLIYDQYNTYENGQGLWIRGIYGMDDGVATLNSITKIMLIALPVLLLLAILAGRRITNKAFEPVAKTTKAVNSISSGKDLSMRLPQGQNKDELYFLTETLNEMLTRLEEAFQSEKEFSSDVSHELKTPLSVILAECEYTLAENRSIDEYKEAIETIQNQCGRTMSLIQQLLQVSRTLDKEKALEKEELDLSMLMASVCDELSKVAADRNITLKKNIQQGVNIHADETLIMRMVINLITNAIKYSRDDENPWINVFMVKNGNVVITVEDNGIGIRQEDQKNIFNRFYKVDKSRKSEENSFGLGLAMVKWIAEAHGGTVSVESLQGHGSIFTVKL